MPIGIANNRFRIGRRPIVANITAMADIADARGIRVVLGGLLPVNDYGESRKYLTKERPPAKRGRSTASFAASVIAARTAACAMSGLSGRLEPFSM